MNGKTAIRALVTLALLSTASCGGEEPPPEGYTLRLRFTSLDPVVLENVRVSFQPQGPDERFMFVEPMSYADGAIDLTVEDDGTLTMLLDGAHVAENALEQPDASYIYDLEVYTEDETPRSPAPGVRVVGNRAGERIAEGFLFLPQWPLPLGQSTIVQVPCRMAVSDRCFP